MGNMCFVMGLHEHAKVFPDSEFKASPQARKYVHDLDYHPELNTMHLMPRPIDNICSKLLPGLLGYAVCAKCQGQGNLAQQMCIIRPFVRCIRCADLRKRIDS